MDFTQAVFKVCRKYAVQKYNRRQNIGAATRRSQISRAGGGPGIIDRKKAQPVVDATISCGINCFDTAYSYQDGDSERFLGKALAGYPRNEYLLSTKFYVAYSEDI